MQMGNTLVGGANDDFTMISCMAPSAGVQHGWRGQPDVIVCKLRRAKCLNRTIALNACHGCQYLGA
jgi:hypothetical protein